MPSNEREPLRLSAEVVFTILCALVLCGWMVSSWAQCTSEISRHSSEVEIQEIQKGIIRKN